MLLTLESFRVSLAHQQCTAFPPSGNQDSSWLPRHLTCLGSSFWIFPLCPVLKGAARSCRSSFLYILTLFSDRPLSHSIPPPFPDDPKSLSPALTSPHAISPGILRRIL